MYHQDATYSITFFATFCNIPSFIPVSYRLSPCFIPPLPVSSQFPLPPFQCRYKSAETPRGSLETRGLTLKWGEGAIYTRLEHDGSSLLFLCHLGWLEFVAPVIACAAGAIAVFRATSVHGRCCYFSSYTMKLKKKQRPMNPPYNSLVYSVLRPFQATRARCHFGSNDTITHDAQKRGTARR